MQSKPFISATIVLYQEDVNTVLQTIHSFLAIPFSKKLFLVDNSPKRFSSPEIIVSKEVEYIYVGNNIGFAAANNLVIDEIKERSVYHLILNPDVVFDTAVISELVNVLGKDPQVAMIAPKITYTNGLHQYSVRKYPLFFDLFIRRIGVLKERIHQQEYRNSDLNKSFYPDVIHGCFQLYKTADFVALKGFDERYFLYMEDVDICRKIDAMGKQKLYYPKVSITHVLKQGSSKNIKLFFYHLSSAIKYYLKWS